ncbi:UNKNOWN [Stylonychia lemnae]|uniref:Uncharacterized protein n=1 Tax=Stylonychia lemnae TaxID=5949 RepID=A0A078B4E2_STYLE|nr:UNKNOWN [Stylonychia lemnae]|eukprot:CDW89136.1 UNKNOWN [Stylonychia lemnae]
MEMFYLSILPFYGDRDSQDINEHLGLKYIHSSSSAAEKLFFDIEKIDNSFVSVQVSSPDYQAFKTLLDYSGEQNVDFTFYTHSTKLEVFSGKV